MAHAIITVNKDNTKIRFNLNKRILTVYKQGFTPEKFPLGTFEFTRAFGKLVQGIKDGTAIWENASSLKYTTKPEGNSFFVGRFFSLVRKDHNKQQQQMLNTETKFGNYILRLVLRKGEALVG